VLKTVLDVTVPLLVFLLMALVGLELTAADFRRVAGRLPTVLLATALQVVLWPLVAVGLLAVLPQQPSIATGLLLVAACPSGSMANFFTYVSRANVALSATLTAVSCLAAVVTMPLVLALFRARLDDPAALVVPVPLMIAQLAGLLLLPLLTGMLVRRARPDFPRRHGPALLRLGLAGLAALIAFVVIQEWERLASSFIEISIAVGMLSAIMKGLGWGAGRAVALPAQDRVALAMVLVVRNVSLATAVAVTVLGRTEFAVFAAAYFLNQVPVILAALGLFRLTRSAVGASPQ
jgi:BASS family bile acid:Na+ symporter